MIRVRSAYPHLRASSAPQPGWAHHIAVDRPIAKALALIMPDKGKVERFIRYLRHSFYVPLASRLAREGLIVDRETANLAVGRWLREVANVRVHGTTGEIPAERLAIERVQ
jgi:hypothetical protein